MLANHFSSSKRVYGFPGKGAVCALLLTLRYPAGIFPFAQHLNLHFTTGKVLQTAKRKGSAYMADYKTMYLTLFRTQSQAIVNLQGIAASLRAAQQMTEQIFTETESAELRQLGQQADVTGRSDPIDNIMNR